MADAIASGWGKTEIDRFLAYAVPYGAANDNKTPPPSLGNLELWKTPDGETYASIPREGHLEHWPTSSKMFKNYLSYQHYQLEGKMLSQSALDDQRRTHEGEALFGGLEYPVFNRIGELGRLVRYRTGRNAEVMSHGTTGADVIVTLLEAPVRPIEVGNSFNIFAGCDKRFETCQAKFANAVNFRGFPHIPGQDTIIRYATKGDANAGTVL